nr:SRPBCC family protein [Micromonospora sp. DSM 115978]
MSIDRFRHTVAIPVPAERIWAHLIDPYSYVGLSPLLVAVDEVQAARDERGRDVVTYLAVERFRAGPLRWDNRIRVTMTATDPGRQLVSEVVSPGKVRLTATVDLTECPAGPSAPAGSDGVGTDVTETVVVHSPWPLRRFVAGQAHAVQLRRAAELAHRMTAS